MCPLQATESNTELTVHRTSEAALFLPRASPQRR